jgi:EmrB/QacA subfamily drug resistance transporter
MQTTSRRARGWVLALASIGGFMVALDTLVVTTALSAIRLHLRASIGALEWTVNAYTLSFAVLLMTGAALGDRFGRRRMLAAGLGLFALASAGCTLAPGAGWLIAARALQGAGGALVTPLAMALVSGAFAPDRRGWALGIFTGAIGVAALAGPVVGGAITQAVGWQWIFWLNVPTGLALVPLVLRRVPESFGPRAAPDLVGVALVTAAALGLVWGLVRADRAGWGSVEVVATLAAGVLLTAAFVRWELRAPAPMLPMRLFRSPAFSAGNAATFFLYGSNLGALFFLAQFQQTALGQRPLGAGLRLLPFTAAFFLVAPRAGALADRIGEREPIVAGLALVAAGLTWLALIAAPGLGYAPLIAPMVLVGAGMGTALPACQRAVMGAVEPSQLGTASGVFNTVLRFGGVLGLAIAVTAFSAAGGYGSPQAFSDGFTAAFAGSAALALAGALAGLALPTTRRTAPDHVAVAE